MSIRPLPDHVVAQIKSSTTITTLNGVVCGLLKNSLDAGASKITVSVDYARGNCFIEDDGLGILPAEFEPDGGVGRLHFTSKYPLREDIHGKYGTFLASLASLSLLSITSHHHQYHTHNSIHIHNSEILARHIPTPLDQRLQSVPHGTRITVRNLFGSMPVRVKQRAVDTERGTHPKYWEYLKRDVIALILAWDQRVSVSVREPANRWTFSVHGNQTHRANKEFGLEITAKVSKILYQAQLSDENKTERWVPLRASAGRLAVIGAVSLYPVATKRNQFISIGIRPVSNEHGSNVLHEEINRIFSNSSYGVEEKVGDLTTDEHERTAEDGRYKTDGFTSQELKGRKGVDRWPMFYIKIYVGECKNSIASEIDELLDERHGNLASIVDILKAVFYEFLRKYHFRPKRIRNTGEDIPRKNPRPGSPKRTPSREPGSKPTPTTETRKNELVGDLATTRLSIRCDHSSRSRPESPFDLWSRVKSGSPQEVPSEKKVSEHFPSRQHQAAGSSDVITPNLDEGSPTSVPPLFGPDGNLLRAPFVTIDPVTGGVDQEHQSVGIKKGSLNEDIRWTNPATKETLTIDPITGFVIQPPNKCPKEEHGQADLVNRERFRSNGRPASSGNRCEWLGDLLSSWENPVFKITEPQIPSACDEMNSLGQPLQPFGCDTWLQGSREVGLPIQGRVSKAALRNAEIIAQVDRKFIFAKVLVDSKGREPIISHLTASLLIIIDQHAADERCRVESLMKDYFQRTCEASMSDKSSIQAASMSGDSIACTDLLEPPLKFDVSIRDATQLERMITRFVYWGIHYHIVPVSQTRSDSHRQVEVTRLPPSIAERCRLEPRLLIELLRKEIWKVDEHNHCSAPIGNTNPQSGEAPMPHWITRFHGCPEGVLDMINSRACRSSIMFNDPLSREECTNLLERLADCAFPFQCAHGRPSMVPLVDLGDSMACTSSGGEPAESYRKAFKAWNASGWKKYRGE